VLISLMYSETRLKPTQVMVAIATILLAASPLAADLTINFTDGDPSVQPFNGNSAGTSVVSTLFVSPSSTMFSDGTIGTITTETVTGSGTLTTKPAGLGIDSGTGNADEIDGGEEWSFSWDVGTQFLAITLANVKTGVLKIKSNDWQNLPIITNDPNSSFDSLTGELTFNFSSLPPPSSIGSAPLSLPSGLLTSAGEQIRISYTSAVGTGTAIQSMTFTNPEPSTIILTTVGLAAFGAGSWWKKRKAKGDRSASTDTEAVDPNDTEAITS